MALLTKVMRSIFLVSFFLAILPPLPEGQQFADGFTAADRFFFWRFELVQSLEGGFHHMEDIGAAHRFGQNVVVSGGLENGTSAARCDDARTSRSRFEQHLGPSRAASDLMRDGCASHRDAADGLMSTLGRFAHGIRYGIGFADSQPNAAVAIADDNGDTELEAATAFDDFSHASDLDDALFELLFHI